MRTTALTFLTALALLLGLTVLDPATAATPAYKVTLRTSVAKSTAEHFILVSGTVTGPKAAGHTVTIQRRYVGGAWTTVATATISSHGRYKARVETPRGGTTSFRAIKPRSSARRAGVSATRSIPVYEWLYLSSVNAIASQGVLQGTTATIGGRTYPRSITMNGSTPGIEFKLGGLCTNLATLAQYQETDGGITPATMDIGFTDYPTNGGSPKSVAGGTLAAGFGAVSFTPAIAGTNVLVISTDEMDNGYQLALGDPKVYCNADHLPNWTSSDL